MYCQGDDRPVKRRIFYTLKGLYLILCLGSSLKGYANARLFNTFS